MVKEICENVTNTLVKHNAPHLLEFFDTANEQLVNCPRAVSDVIIEMHDELKRAEDKGLVYSQDVSMIFGIYLSLAFIQTLKKHNNSINLNLERTHQYLI